MLINEFLPNPIGKDTEGEYISLLNDGAEIVNLTGWVLKDISGKKFSLSGYALAPNEAITIPYAISKITLNNNGETIYLLNPQGEVVHELGYSGTAEEGRVITEARALTEEQIQEYFEPSLSDITGTLPAHLQESAISIMFLSAIIMSLFSVWIIKSVENL